MEFYASCPEGFESALADELKRLGLSHVRRLKGRATFEGELEEGYRACLWSRLASRVFVVLGRFEAQDADELYDSVYDIAWETIIRPGATIAITARGVTEQLRALPAHAEGHRAAGLHIHARQPVGNHHFARVFQLMQARRQQLVAGVILPVKGILPFRLFLRKNLLHFHKFKLRMLF